MAIRYINDKCKVFQAKILMALEDRFCGQCQPLRQEKQTKKGLICDALKQYSCICKMIYFLVFKK